MLSTRVEATSIVDCSIPAPPSVPRMWAKSATLGFRVRILLLYAQRMSRSSTAISLVWMSAHGPPARLAPTVPCVWGCLMRRTRCVLGRAKPTPTANLRWAGLVADWKPAAVLLIRRPVGLRSVAKVYVCLRRIEVDFKWVVTRFQPTKEASCLLAYLFFLRSSR